MAYESSDHELLDHLSDPDYSDNPADLSSDIEYDEADAQGTVDPSSATAKTQKLAKKAQLQEYQRLVNEVTGYRERTLGEKMVLLTRTRVREPGATADEASRSELLLNDQGPSAAHAHQAASRLDGHYVRRASLAPAPASCLRSKSSSRPRTPRVPPYPSALIPRCCTRRCALSTKPWTSSSKCDQERAGKDTSTCSPCGGVRCSTPRNLRELRKSDSLSSLKPSAYHS